jgi:hypothetical protein
VTILRFFLSVYNSVLVVVVGGGGVSTNNLSSKKCDDAVAAHIFCQAFKNQFKAVGSGATVR